MTWASKTIRAQLDLRPDRFCRMKRTPRLLPVVRHHRSRNTAPTLAQRPSLSRIIVNIRVAMKLPGAERNDDERHHSTLTPAAPDPERAHRCASRARGRSAVALVLAIGAYGFDYYTLSAADRPFSPKHALLRPSGPDRDQARHAGRWHVLDDLPLLLPQALGMARQHRRTKHWLDFHIVLGVTAPIIIAFHAAFKFRGIAGMAFWIMVAVALSGIVGRYLYAQIPRHLNAAEFTWQELQEEQLAPHAPDGARRRFLLPGDLVAAFHIPDVEMVRHNSADGSAAVDVRSGSCAPVPRRGAAAPGAGLWRIAAQPWRTLAEQQSRARESGRRRCGGRRLSRSEWCFFRARNRFSSSGTWCTGRSATPLSFWRSAHRHGHAAGLSIGKYGKRWILLSLSLSPPSCWCSSCGDI